MSRYIDADAVKNIIRSGVSTDTEADQEYVCECIDEASSIEIIRCGECKHWHEKDGLTYCDRIDYGYGYKSDDFCSYGSRSEKPNNSTISKMEQVDKDINVRSKESE